MTFEQFLTESKELRLNTSAVSPKMIHDAITDKEAYHELAKGVYGRSFELKEEETSHMLKPVDLANKMQGTQKDKIEKVIEFLKEYGFKPKFFTSNSEDVGVNCLGYPIEAKPFNLKKHGYEKGNVWIYNPCDSKGSFDDNLTTFLWRIVHELAHGITEELMDRKYGLSRRFGAMNHDIRNPYDTNDKRVYKGLTLLESQRSIEWEDVAFRAQEILFKELGLHIPKENHILDFNIAGHDVILRLLTGKFSDPGDVGVVPNNKGRVSVKDVLTFIENQYLENSKYLGTKADKGIDLKSWKPYSDSEIKAEIKKFRNNPNKAKILEAYFNERTISSKKAELHIGDPFEGGYYIGDYDNYHLVASTKDYEHEFNWHDAIDYGAHLNIEGHKDWMLPNTKEADIIAFNARFLPDDETLVGWYHTSEENLKRDRVTMIHMTDGSKKEMHPLLKAKTRYVIRIPKESK